MHCKLLESDDRRRKYVVYPPKGYFDKYPPEYSTHFIGYIVAIKYINALSTDLRSVESADYWDIEVMHIIKPRKGFGSCLLSYVLNDLKNMTSLITTHPTTEGAISFFTKHHFTKGFQGQEYLYFIKLN